MKRRRFERVAAMLLSLAMLLTSTGTIPSLAGNVSGSSTAPSSSSVSETAASEVTEEGGRLTAITAAQEGGSVNTQNKGNGTIENPYLVSNTEDLLAMQNKINSTKDANKYFVLTADIDLSGITVKYFLDNGGSLVATDKKLSAESENVFMSLNGCGHTIKGLNITDDKAESLSILGFVNARSCIKNINFADCRISSVSAKLGALAVVAAENEGSIRNISIETSVLTARKAENTGMVTAVNEGTISNVTIKGFFSNVSVAEEKNHTISASGNTGVAAGYNRGTINAVTAMNVGAYIPADKNSKTVYGGITGANAGTVSGSFSSGTVCGGKATDYAGGVAGKMLKEGKKLPALTNNYTLVSFNKGVNASAVAGSGAEANMLKDCFWSSAISGRQVMADNYCTGINDMSASGFKIVSAGNTIKIPADEFNTEWGKAIVASDGSFTASGEGVGFAVSKGGVTVTGKKVNSVSYIKYTADITLPGTVGAGDKPLTVRQYMCKSVLTVPENAKGDGTKANPLAIDNAETFALVSYVPQINCIIAEDFAVSGTVAAFSGKLSGNNHTVRVKAPVFGKLFGTVENITFNLTKNIDSAVLGSTAGATVNNVVVKTNDDAALTVKNSGTGLMFNRISGKSTIDNCSVSGKIQISDEKLKNIGAFAGIVDGRETVITNSGAVADIEASAMNKNENTANFIGAVKADGVRLANCYTGGNNKAGRFTFVGGMTTEKITVNTVYTNTSADKNSAKEPIDFAKYEKLISREQFIEWGFDNGNAGFFTGAGGEFTITLPTVKTIAEAKAEDFGTICDSRKLGTALKVQDGRLVLSLKKAENIVTVKDIPVTVINNRTGLKAAINISNGLLKDSQGRLVISSAYDLAYVSENIEECKTASFVMNDDVDMSLLKEFTPIGSTKVAFSGHFEGNGHKISNLKIDGTAKTGLFGTLKDAVVKNIVFENAVSSAKGSYTGVLAGLVTGKTQISGITVSGADVSAESVYSGILVGSVDGALSGFGISDINISNSRLNATANYAGAVVGSVYGSAVIKNIKITGTSVSGAVHVSGAVGLIGIGGRTEISNISVEKSKICGISEVSGIASASSNNAVMKNVSVKSTDIYTISDNSAYTAGGIASVFGSVIEKALVKDVTIKSGIAGGIAGRTAENGKLIVRNAKAEAVDIRSSSENTIAAGILALHRESGDAVIENSYVDGSVKIHGASVTAGIAGDISGKRSGLAIKNVKTFAEVAGSMTATAVSSAGVVARLGASAVNNVTVTNVTVGGKVSGNGALGGFIGLIKDGNKFSEKSLLISDSIAYAEITSGRNNAASAGMIIGNIENNRAFVTADADKAIQNVIISTYYSNTNAYSKNSNIKSQNYADMDKPGGNPIKTSVETLTSPIPTRITISNLPRLEGYSFDAETGWTSESSERIEIIESTENSALLKPNYIADIAITGYYVSAKDRDVRVPVHFKIKADIRTPLKGSGTKSDPYLVGSAYELETMSQYAHHDAYFVLSDDIVFNKADFVYGGAFFNAGNGIVTIGRVENAFRGHFSGLYNGKVHSIEGLNISGNTFGGLFGAADGAEISDLAIKDATVTGHVCAGIITGNARNTVIRNITLTNVRAEADESGGVAGLIMGCGVNTVVENINADNAQIIAPYEQTAATVEAAGGVAGVFSGRVSGVKLSSVTIRADEIAGGITGVLPDNAALKAEKINIDADIEAFMTAGGIAGKIFNPLKVSVGNAVIGGNIRGQKAGGILGEVTANNNSSSLSEAKAPVISNTVVSAAVRGTEYGGIAVGKAFAKIFADKSNAKFDIFDKLYYSSYRNSTEVFGVEELNTYQNGEYEAIDLSSMKYADEKGEYDSLPSSRNELILADDSIILNKADGTYKSFRIGTTVFNLEKITSDTEGAVAYNPKTSEFRVNTGEKAKALFCYNNGLVLAMDISQENILAGEGTKEKPYLVSTSSDFNAMSKYAENKNVYFSLTADINLKDAEPIENFAANLSGNGFVLSDYTGTSLFKWVTGTISSVGFAGFRVQSRDALAVGAVTEVLDGGVIENCFVIADVKLTGANQDGGIIAGRMTNGAKLRACVTTGRITGVNALSVGGAVGAMNNSELTEVLTTAYVEGKNAGGIVGEAEYSKISAAIFANMVEGGRKAGNIVGINRDNTTSIDKTYFDSCTARVQNAIGEGKADFAYPKTTEKLAKITMDGFTNMSGYPVPTELTKIKNSQFKTSTAFASMLVRYLSGLNAGTATDYSEIRTETEINKNAVLLDCEKGLTITLVPKTDFAETKNAISRYSNPVTTQAAEVSYEIIDMTSGKSYGNKIIGILLKSKSPDKTNAFDFFVNAREESRKIDKVSILDGALYVNADMPSRFTVQVEALNENSKLLKTEYAGNDGFRISADGAKKIHITIVISDKTEAAPWGLRSVWSSIR